MEHSRLRFEDEAAAVEAGTSGQIGPKSGKRKRRSRLREDSDQPRPSERLRQEERTAPDPTGTAGTADPGGEGAPPSGETPPGNTSRADTSGQFGPKSKGQKKTEKSKLKMERTGEKLNTAKEKLAAQKPPKKPGAVKKLGKAAGRTAHGFVHGKIYQVEHENVGTDSPSPQASTA